jgi:hypothetical protein
MTRTVAVLALLLICAPHARAGQSWRDGDIIFHTSRSAQSVAIQRATHSRYSHVGIIFIREGQPHVFEAIATVRYTPLAKWTARGADSRYVVKRLKRGLTNAQAARIRAAFRGQALRPVLRVVRCPHLLLGAHLEDVLADPWNRARRAAEAA